MMRPDHHCAPGYVEHVRKIKLGQQPVPHEEWHMIKMRPCQQAVLV
jgi:hypothetical protein